MMRSLMIVMLILCSSFNASAAEEVIAVFPTDVLSTPTNQPFVTMSMDPTVSLNGKASVKITYTGLGSERIKLFEVDKLPMMGNCVLEYYAAIRSQETKMKASFEMWFNFPNRKPFISQGMNQALASTQNWYSCTTTFYLKKNQSPASTTLYVHFYGPETVWITDARLVKKPPWPLNILESRGAIMGILGGMFGSILGIWGAIVGTLTSRGKGKRFVLVSGAVFLVIGILLLVGGLYCLVTGFPWDIWYALVLTGGIDVAVLGPVLWGVRARYHLVETQRLHARDQAENL